MQNLRKRVPTILTADEILDKAFRKVNKIDKQGPDKVELVKRKSMARIASATDVISSTLMKYVKAFPSINERTDFLAEMIEVTVGVDKMKKALGNLDWAASKIKELQKQYTSKVMTSTSTFAADNARKAYYGRASSVVNKVGPDLEFLSYARNEFRKVPDFNDATFAAVEIDHHIGDIKNLLGSDFQRPRRRRFSRHLPPAPSSSSA